jgi:predicted permease
MSIVDTLVPLILLIGLGAALAHIQFLGREFMADLNKLAFWIALPALLFRAAIKEAWPGQQTWMLLGVMIAATFVISGLAWLVSRSLGVPRSAQGTMVQSAFRGNLAYIGVPVLASISVDDPRTFAVGVVVMTLTMALYNVLAVVVLQASRPAGPHVDRWALVRSIGTNPLLLAGLSGLACALVHIGIPAVLDRTLDTLGAAAVPIALLCIGGSLRTSGFSGRRSWIAAAAALKIAVLPAIVFALGRAAGLGRSEQRIALVFAAAPTAAAAYIMAREMDGDETLASGSIALSTVLSMGSLAAVLWIMR